MSDDGNWTASDSIVRPNTNAEIPRTYIDEYGEFYNYFAAFAENPNSADSICPNGWQIPESGDTARSWQSLLLAYDADLNSTALSELVRKMPISLTLPGTYSELGARVGGLAHYFTKSSYTAGSDTIRQLRLYPTAIYIDFTHVVYSGESIRCVQK